MLLRATFALAASLAVAGSAVAKDVQIGSATLNLPSPGGYCELTDKEPSDARVLKEIGNLVAGSQNELLSMSADCSQLEAWRAGKLSALDDYVQYQTPAGTKQSNTSRATSVKGFCANIRKDGEKAVSGVAPDLNARLETAVQGAKFNEASFLGVLAEDSDVCYYGLLLKIRTETGDEKTQVTVAATTVVKGKVVYYNLYTVYRNGADTLSAALERHRRNVPALLAANGELSGSGEVAKNDAGRPVPAKAAAAKEATVQQATVQQTPAQQGTVQQAPAQEVHVREVPAAAPATAAPTTEQVANYSASLAPDKVKGGSLGHRTASHSWRNGHCLYEH